MERALRFLRCMGSCIASCFFISLAHGQGVASTLYDGDWNAKVSCSESTQRRPPFTYETKIQVQNGKIDKIFTTRPNNIATNNKWVGVFEKNKVVLEINGSNDNGGQWRYNLQGHLFSPYAVFLTGSFFNAQGNKIRSCDIALNSDKPEQQLRALQSSEQEIVKLKGEVEQRNRALEQERRSGAAQLAKVEQAQKTAAAQLQSIQRAEQEIARLKNELEQKNQAIVQERNSTRAHVAKFEQMQGLAEKHAKALQLAENEIVRLKAELSQKESTLGELRRQSQGALQAANNFFVESPREDLKRLSTLMRMQSSQKEASSTPDFERLSSLRSIPSVNQPQINKLKRSEAMYGFLEGMLTLSGLILLASLVVPRFDPEKKWTALFDTLSAFSFKLSAVALAAMMIYITYTLQQGVLSISAIGLYVACASIMISSLRDLFSGSQFLTNLATVASHKANVMQEEVNRKAAEMAEATKKSESQDKSP